MADIVQIIVTVIAAVGGWEAIRYFINLRTNKRRSEAAADADEFHVLRETTEFLQLQLKLKEERFAEQTQVVRKQTAELLETIKQKANVEMELQRYRCIVERCPKRDPQNGY